MRNHIYLTQLPTGRWICTNVPDFLQARVIGYGATPFEARRNFFRASSTYI